MNENEGSEGHLRTEKSAFCTPAGANEPRVQDGSCAAPVATKSDETCLDTAQSPESTAHEQEPNPEKRKQHHGENRAQKTGVRKGNRKRRNTMGKQKKGKAKAKEEVKSQSAYISRVDYPSKDFRVGLLEKAKEKIAQDNNNFVVLAAGLISASAVREIIMDIKASIKAIVRQIKKLEAGFKEREKDRKKQDTESFKKYREAANEYKEAKKELSDLNKRKKKAPEALRKEKEERVAETKAEMNKWWSLHRASSKQRENRSERDRETVLEQIGSLEDVKESFVKKLDEWKPESMAEYLAKVIPRFKNSAGRKLNLYIIPSTAYDGEVGIETARVLSELRKDIILYSADRDKFPLKKKTAGLDKIVEILTPQKAVWMRGLYDATPVQRLLADRDGIADVSPDLFVIGGFGSAMYKPIGEHPIPWVSLPALHNITGVRTSENQIGITTISIHPEHANPKVHFHALKDLVSNERQTIGYPRDATELQRQLIDILKKLGNATSGTLGRSTGLPEETVNKEMELLAHTSAHLRNTTWPGVIWDDKSRKWKFPSKWIQNNLRYPEPAGKKEKDVVAGYSCLHAGSKNLDPYFVKRELPKRILDHGVTVLYGVGDFVQGLIHNQAQRGELHPAFWNLALQEEFAGRLIASVTVDVFRARFPDAIKRMRKQVGDNDPTDEEIHSAIKEALLQNIMIEGNHDEWCKRAGSTPLLIMRSEMIRIIRLAIEKELEKNDLRTIGLDELVEDKTRILRDGHYALPSGIKTAASHPHMSRTLTASIRAQAALKQNSITQLAILGNFHVGIGVHRWDHKRGQCCALQIGTFMLKTEFEISKQKTRLDHGFAVAELNSVNGRIQSTEITYYGYSDPINEGRCMDPYEPFKQVMGEFDLDEF
jgi:hypothetical protein